MLITNFPPGENFNNRRDKQMSIFDGKSKEEKKAEKIQKMMHKYQLDDLDPKFIEAVKNIQTELAGTGLGEFGVALSMTDMSKALPIYYLRSIIEQNWIIIRQLEDIRKNTER